MPIENRLVNDLNDRKRVGNHRTLSLGNGNIDFASNDYLGLARCEKLHQRITDCMNELKINGSTGSRLLTGNSELIHLVEEELAEKLSADKILLFDSGYMANLGVLSCIPKRGDTILYDELAHACIKDGARLSLASRYSFRHNDLHDLENKIKRATGQVFIVVESIYSMDGDECPIDDLVHLSNQHNANIIIDEAHGTGVLGHNGNGLSGKFTHDDIFCRIYTFGKAMGIHGAAVSGSKMLIDYLINFSRPFIYTTAPSPHSVVSVRESFRYLLENIGLQKMIKERLTHFNLEFERQLSKDINKVNSNHPIQALIIPGNQKVKQVASSLNEQGFDVRPILSPTVKQGQERLRICLHSYNNEEEISSLIDVLNKLI